MNKNTLEKVQELHKQGLSTRAIAKALNIGKTSAWKYLKKALSFSKEKKDQSFLKKSHCFNDSDNVVQFILDNFKPVKFDSLILNRKKAKQNSSNTALVIGDIHFGYEDQRVLDLFFEVVSQIRPRFVILNGDTLDFSCISRYPKDHRNLVSLKEEREKFLTFLHELLKITESYQTQIIETNANHSGNDQSGRWWRYLNDRIGEIVHIPEIANQLSYTSIFHPQLSEGEQSRLSLVDNYEIVPNKLIVLHGDLIRKKSGYTAAALLEKWHISLICNHTHRVGMSSRTIPSVGNREPMILTCYENGCACSLTPFYITAPDWQHAFAIVHYDNESFNVEQVIIRNKTACIGSLGRTFKI